MKRSWIAVLVGVLLFVVVTAPLLKPSRERQIQKHLRGWRESVGSLSKEKPVPFLDRLRHFVQDNDMNPGVYWSEIMKGHERSLLGLGYLTNAELHLTNQVITREFSSNFFRLINQRVGTNEDQVWLCPYLTNQTGIAPTFPAKDYAIWEQIFRECAVRYASNLPPTSVTAEGGR